MTSSKTYSAILFCLSFASITAVADDVLLNQFVRLANGAVSLKAGGTDDQVCSLLVSRNLETWRTLDFTNPAGAEATFLDNSAALATNRFYRAQLHTSVPDITTVTYHGWANSILMRNSLVEVAIVPTIGRIMQFRFRDQADGPFWENTSMNGLQPSASSWNTPGSFGGDKVWPSPQSWPWPPPRGFDSMNYTATISGGIVTMTGPVDSTFGTRVVRRISLHPTEAILRVSTTFEKVSSINRRIGVWVVTQLKDAERVFMPVPTNTVFPRPF